MKICSNCENVDNEENEIQLFKKHKENINYFHENFELEKIGFDNIGNSCYMNSFLQILLHIPNFLVNLKTDYYKSKKESQLIKNIINLSDYPNNKKYLYLIQNYMSGISSNYEQFNQSDSQNFGIDLINEIIINIKGEEDETSSEYNKNINKNIINIINYKKNKYNEFIKKYQNEEQQISLEKMFNVNEYLNLKENNAIFKYSFFCSLGIELVFPNKNKNIYNLNDLLNYKYNNENSSKKICNAPKILIITILRAFVNEELNRSTLEFPQELNISSYVDKDLINNNDCLKYKLFAINEKKSLSKENGHYYCLINLKKQWFLFNDRNVSLFENYIKESYCSNNVVGLFYINLKYN